MKDKRNNRYPSIE
jgi:hypothetical protein